MTDPKDLTDVEFAELERLLPFYGTDHASNCVLVREAPRLIPMAKRTLEAERKARDVLEYCHCGETWRTKARDLARKLSEALALVDEMKPYAKRGLQDHYEGSHCGDLLSAQLARWDRATIDVSSAPYTVLVDRLRADGWSVAVHNDYRLNGKPHTFWLFTKGNRCVKGEGRTDSEALAAVCAALDAPLAPPEVQPGICACGHGKAYHFDDSDGMITAGPCQMARWTGVQCECEEYRAAEKSP